MKVFLDDIAEGQEFLSTDTVVTEQQIDTFADLSGDHAPLHTNDEWVRAHTGFTGRIAHGMLVASISSGLATPGVDDWVVLAFMETSRRMVRPVYPGDRLSQVLTVESVRRSRSVEGAGIVVVGVSMTNQDGEVVQTGQDVFLVEARGAGDDTL